jgi:hypothetical protein
MRMHGFPSQSATLKRMPKIKKNLNDASIKNFLCRINVFSYTLLVAMAEVGSMQRIEINTPHVSPQTKCALKSPVMNQDSINPLRGVMA